MKLMENVPLTVAQNASAHEATSGCDGTKMSCKRSQPAAKTLALRSHKYHRGGR